MGKAIIYYIIALAIILGITSMVIQSESCGSKSNLATIHANDLSADKADAEPADDLEEDDDYEPEDEHNDATGSTTSDEDADDDQVDPIEGDEPEYSDDDPAAVEDYNEDEEEVAARTSSSRNDGAYLVIAGAFSSESNAEGEVSRLRDSGYPNAEIVEFDFSDFYSVCVARYDTRDDAQAVANSIVSKSGKKAYVHKRRNKK